MKWLQRTQAGDTLVEVVMSLAILAVTLVAGFDISNRSYSTGFQSREQTQAVYLAQDQAEKLYAYRDNLVANAVAKGPYDPHTNPYVIQPLPAYFGTCANANGTGCHFDLNPSSLTPLTPIAGSAQPVLFNGITYYVVIVPMPNLPPSIAAKTLNGIYIGDGNYDEGFFQVQVSWNSAVSTGVTAPTTGDTGNNENLTTLNVTVTDNRGITPRDCSVVGSVACS